MSRACSLSVSGLLVHRTQIKLIYRATPFQCDVFVHGLRPLANRWQIKGNTEFPPMAFRNRFQAAVAPFHRAARLTRACRCSHIVIIIAEIVNSCQSWNRLPLSMDLDGGYKNKRPPLTGSPLPHCQKHLRPWIKKVPREQKGHPAQIVFAGNGRTKTFLCFMYV